MKNFTKFLTASFIIILSCFSQNSSLAQCAIGETYNTSCYGQGEVNIVQFEFCPSAGQIAQSTIIAGAVGGFAPINTLTVYEGSSGSGTGGNIVFGPASSADFSGTVITASAADLCLIFVINSATIAITCADGVDAALEVCSESIVNTMVNFTAPADLCINAGVQAGLGGGSPTGGVYSGSGVTDDGNGLTYSFDPAAAGLGVHTLTYTNGGSASDDIEVFATGTATFTALADLCIDAGIQTGLGGGLPAGGVYSGSGVTDDGNGMTYTFNPGIAGLGIHTLTYTESGACNNSATDDVEVTAACGCPVGQNSNFHCSAAGETNLVIFEICPNAAEFAQATINAGTYSSTGNNLTVYQGPSGSGTGGTIIYGPQTGNLAGNVITGTVIDQCLIFVSNTIAGGCQDGLETALEVCGESINLSFTAPADVCVDDGVLTGLSGGFPTGGVYSGPGVTDDGNGMTYSFDPAAAGIGVHTLSYTESGNTITDDIEVFAVPVVTFTALADLCLDGGLQTGLGGGSPTGGIYSGPGVTDNGNGVTYTFDPLAAGIGVHTITYTEGSACMEVATDDVEVTAACSCPVGEVTYFNCYDNNETNLVIFEVCPNAGEFAKAEISLGTYGSPDDALTIYQGASGSGTGGAIVFGPLNGNLSGNIINSTTIDECLIFVNNSGPLGSCADGFEASLIVCGSSLASNVMFTALPDLSVNAGIQTGLSGGTPTGGVYSGPGVTDDGNGMTYTFDPAAAGVGVHTLTYTVGGNSATDDVEVFNLLPPAFSKSFSPNEMGPGSVSTLTFTIDNSGSGTGVTDIAFTDNLPVGMTVADPPVIINDCSGATVTAVAGSSTITVSDGTLTSGTSCTISVNVTSTTSGTQTNTTGDLTSSAGNSGTASANLTVATNRPGFFKSFSPASVNLGERSTLTLTIDNTANTGNVLGITFTDNLPAEMVIASPSNASSTNTGIGTFTAVPGTNVISYNTTGFTEEIAIGGTATFTVDVVGNAVGTLDNVTDNLTTRNNLFQQFSCGKASASLEVVPPGKILLQKSFSTNPVNPGGTTNLEFTITNLDRDFPATNISFTDDLTTVLAGLTATGTPLNDICGTGSQLSGTTMLTFTGGTIPADGSCTFSIPVQVPAGAALGTYTNVTSTITADINGSTETGNPATENLFIANVPTITKNFLNDPITAGGTTTLEFTITNTSTTSALTQATFTDNISAFLSGATISSQPAAGSCGAGSLFFTTTSGGDLLFQMNGGNIPPGGACTFTIDLSIPTGAPGGVYTNTTSSLSATVDGATVNSTPATDDLTVLAVPTLTKSFTDDPVNAGDIVNLEFTISYDEFATGDATSISFSDDLNAVIPGLAAVGLPLNDVCGIGSQISGTTNLTFTGGTLSPGETCTFSVPVQVPAGTVTGSYNNVTSALTATVGGQSATGNSATDDLKIGGLDFTKEFLDNPIIPGQLTTLRFTFDNTSTFDATNIVFTDNLNGVLSGLTTEGALPTGAAACNGNAFGTTFLIYTGGSVDAGTSCTLDIPVRVPASATSGTYTNVTSNLTATIDGATRVLDPAIAPLVVDNNLIQIEKSFTDDPVAPGGAVTVEYTLTNLDPVNPVSNIAFTDDFDGALTGLTATGLPMAVCSGTVSGTGLLSFTGGTLAAGASCTFSVTLQTPASTPYGTVVNCPTSGVTGDIGGLPVIGDAANDDLQFQSLELSKSFSSSSVAPGETVTLTFTITNFDPVNSINQVSFTDDLDAFISGMVATSLPPIGSCGPLSEVTGTSLINFGRGELGAGQSCSFDVTVLVPCGTTPATYMNTTSLITADGANGPIVSSAASQSLTISGSSAASFTAPADLCIDAGVQTSLGGGTPTGGVYSGTGVTDNGNGTTFSFDPSTAGIGTHTITYTLTDGNGCTTDSSDDIEIFDLPTVTFTAPSDLCIDAGVQAGLGGETPTGGVYSGSGVTDDGNGMTYSFDPAGAGVGTHTLTYTFTDANGCTNSASDDVEVFALPIVTFTAPADLCIDAGVQAGLGTGSPTGGVYSGTGVTDDGNGMTYSFDPAAAGAGIHTLTYFFTDANGCTATATDDVEVFDLPIVAFTAPADLCIDAGVQAGLGGGTPTGGVYSGSGVTDDGNGMTYSFDPAAAGTGVHTLTYAFTDTNGCSNSASDDVEVFALPIVTFTALADLCIDAGVQAGLGGGTPTGGVYSGAGVTDDGNGMTFSFAPATAGAGTHTLTYTFTDANGCSDSASDDVEVFPLPSADFTAPADLCVDAGLQTGLGSGTPTGGVYSGTGVTDDGNGMTYSFDPAAAGVGTHTITYMIGIAGCFDSASDDVEVFGLPIVTFTALADLCIDAGVQAGLGGGTPTGGLYSGSGVTDDGNGMTYSFDPAAAGVGTHTLTYTFTDTNGCTNSASDDVEVFDLPIVNFTAPADLCIDAGVQAGLGGGTPTGGVYSGSGVTDDGNGMTFSFDPAAAGVGTHNLTYTFTDANGCTDSASDDIEVFDLPIVTFTAPDDLCIDAGVQAGLGGGTPTGGVYSGSGITDDGNGMTYSFDPAAGVGTHTLTYTFTDIDGCTNSASDDVEVFGLPIVTFTALADLCIDAGVQAGLGGGTPTGGVYSGSGVTNDGNGMTYSFDPAAAGVGTHTLTYTFTDTNGCTNSASDDVEVFDLPIVNFTAPTDLCIDAGVQAGLGGGTLTGGVYSGSGVTDDGNGMTYSFDPATAGVGTHTLTYSFTDTNGCSDSASDDVEVFALPIVTFTAPADICLNAGVQAGLGGGLPTGGVYSGSGVTDDGNGMTYSFDPAAAGTGVHTLTYDFTDTNGCTGSASDDIEVFNSLTATFTAPADLCENAGIQTGLSGGMPIAGLGDTGIYSGSGVNDDGNNMTYSFDPAVAGVGTHTITYTFTSADGCTGSASDDIEVFGVPAATFTVDYISGCEGNGTCAGTSTLIAPIDGSGIFKFYDADPNAGGATLLAGPASSYDPMTTAATSPQSIWVVECLPGICDSEAEVVVVTIVTNPTPTISVPTLPTSLSCEMAVSYSPPTATFTNGLTGDCENSGSGIIGTVTSNFTACGGSVSVTYSGTDNCGNTITAGPFMIPVDPAPAATLTVPSLPTSLSCEMADTYVALDATYDNGLTGICENSGNISATISDNWTTCGGVISVTYSGTDDCGNALSAGPFTITVDPAPVPTVTEPTYPSVLSCIDAENFVAPDATYTNGLTGNCNISGVLPAGVDNNWDACGGTIVLHYFGVDDCGNFLSIPSITITVQAAPIPTVSFPILPNSISCENAGTYIPPSAPFDNGLSGACNISGNIPALVNYFYDACGGTIEVIYSGEDDCGRNLAAVVTVIPVDPAPAPTVNLPTYPSELTCSEAEALDGIFAPYNNGLIGDCEISGLLEAELIMDVTAGAGGTVTVVYSGEDDCGNILSATPIVIPVLPASIPTIQLPDDPDFLYCWDANNFTPGIATFSNGENGFCENSGELDLTGFEEYWDNCDGGYILLQYSGLDNAGNFLQTDLYKIPVIPDAFAPQGVCVDLNIKLDDIKDTPSPDELGDYQNQIASSYFETCGNVNVTLVTDSGVPECGLDGTFERIYEFEITDDCGNSAGICSVTFSGYCNPLYCTLPQDFYSSPDESFAGLSSLELVDLLISSGTDPIVIGMQECGLTLNNAACIQAGLTGQGPSISLPDDFQFNCGDPISNNLVNQIITTTLNIRYNATLNNGGIDFGNFQIDATCMYIPQSISTQLPTNATVNDLIDLANNFIGCQCTNTCGFSQSVNAELTGIFLGLNSRFNKCHVPGPCFLDGNQNPGGGIVFEPDMKEKIKLGGGTTSVEEILENKNSKLEVILYPNPAEDIINIKLNEGIGKSCFIEIFDARGVKVGEKSYSRLNQNIINFDIQEYHQGIYWMTIKLNDFSQVTKRFVIKK